MNNVLLVFLGGGVGSVARYIMTMAIGRLSGNSQFPWHTLGVNLLGAFLIGALLEIFALRSMPQAMRFLLITGFLGGFTTFSAFSLESTLMLQRNAYGDLCIYVIASVVGTIAALLAGGAVAKPFL